MLDKDLIKANIRNVENFPKEGILFKDITPLLKDAVLFRDVVKEMANILRPYNIDAIAAPESRGFIFGPAVAIELGAGFVPVRKPGKLPWSTNSFTYDLEYGQDTLEMHSDALKKGQRVAIVDDVLATGGTVNACVELIRSFSCEPVGAMFLMELKELEGASKLNIPTWSIVSF